MDFTAHAATQVAREAGVLAQRWLRARGERAPSQNGNGEAAALAPVVRWIAGFVADETFALTAEPDVRQWLDRYAAAQRSRGRGPAELLQDFDALARVLDAACVQWLASCGATPLPEEIVAVSGRLNRAPLLLGAASIESYMRDSDGGAAARLQYFADAVMHELKAPLNAASVTAQLLEYAEGGMRSAEARRLALLIHRNLQRADVVLSTLRQAVLPQCEGVEQPMLPFGQVLAAALADLHDELAAGGVHVHVEEPVPAHPVPSASLRLILSNLVRNAIRYRAPGRQAQVRLSFHRDSTEQWWVHVEDNGLGIPEQYRERVFHRGFRAHPESGSGSGVGLMIVQGEVERLGGRIDFTSRDGAGTEFRFSLPRRDA